MPEKTDPTNTVELFIADEGAPRLIVNGVDIANKIKPGWSIVSDEDGVALLTVTFPVQVFA